MTRSSTAGPALSPDRRRPGLLAWSCVVVIAVASAAPALPADGIAGLKIGDGLEATLFAAEPLLSSPTNIDVDAKGRVWVCEVLNYRAKKDTRPEGDRILVLEDTDGDGKADKRTVFHQGRDVDSALGICVIGEGRGRKVIVSCAPNVFIFHDDDGDLVSDRKELLFTKIGAPQHDHSTHAFVVGPDGRLYFNYGNTGNAVHDRDGAPVTDRFGNVVDASGKPYRQGMVFRCRPDGSDFEVLGHNFRNNYEVAVDSFGSLWQSDNDDDGNRGVRINWVMEFGNYGYVDERTGGSWKSPRVNIEAETPLRHWHQNDPGVVPNLLQTGGGSPTGICVYEGNLLPKRFHGSVIHCDAGPRVVRAYQVSPQAAGYSATIEPIIDGSAEQWFRPADVCVAPDGSLMVADWHDPGVGGHGMGDIEKGRIIRIAPTGSRWGVPSFDLSTIPGAIAALASPNLCLRALAIERFNREPSAAAAALASAFDKASDTRLAARFAWVAGMLPQEKLPGHVEQWIAKLLGSQKEDLRIVGLRLARAHRMDVVPLVEKLVGDASVAVRREAAIALRGVTGDRADRAWAALAARHAAGDRWELEALGIGADSPGGLQAAKQSTAAPGAAATAAVNPWDGRLAAWLARIGGSTKTPADREIVWRSRAAAAVPLMLSLIADPSITTAESLALLRALDFQDADVVRAQLPPIVRRFTAAREKLAVVLPDLLLRLDAAAASDPDIVRKVDEAIAVLGPSAAFVDLVQKFGLKQRIGDVVAIAADASSSDALAFKASQVAIAVGGEGPLRAKVAAGGEPAVRLVTVLGFIGGKATEIVDGAVRDAAAPSDVRIAAVRGKVRTEQGAMALVAMAKGGDLPVPLMQAAAHAISSCPWEAARKAAGDVLPMPKGKGGGKLPSVAELKKRQGSPDRGKAVFAGAGTCAKCHIVNGEGKEVGPNLSAIGGKLSREALYESILAPSAAISHNFELWTALLEDGRSVSGLLISKTPEQVVIRGADGLDVTLAAKEIDELAKQPVSLMPADLASAVSADELVDLVAWLETLKQPK